MIPTFRRVREPPIYRSEGLNRRDGIVACGLLALSILVQGLVLAATPAFNGDQVIFGAPVADAWFWHHLAAEIAAGDGIKTPLRPFYSIVLALFLQFAGNSLALAKSLNIVLASASVAVSYLVFRFFAPVSIAVSFAAVLTTSPQFVLFSHSLLSEHAGLLFSLVALVGMLLALDTGLRRWWVLAGVATGLSNLARPLTLFATPFVAAVMLLARGRKTIKPLAIFFLVIAVSIAPWIIHQRIHYRIWSLSSNTMEALYAATSPAYGVWTGREAADLLKEGAIRPGARVAQWNRLYARRIGQNLRSEPQFWLKNTLRTLWISLNYQGLLGGPWRFHGLGCALLVLGVGAYFGWRDRAATRGSAGVPAISIAVTMTLALIVTGMLTGLFSALLLAGMGWALWANRAAGVVLGAYLLGSMISHSMFGFSSGLQRLGMMYEPLTLFLHLFGFYWAGRAGSHVIRCLYRDPTEEASEPHGAPAKTRYAGALYAFERRTAVALRNVAVVGAGLLLIASGRLIYLNLAAPLRPGAPPAREAYLAILESVAAQWKISSTEAARALDPAATLQELGRKDPAGTLVIAEVTTPFSLIDLPPGPSRSAPRPAQIAYLPFFGVGNYWTLFCGRNVEPMLNRRFVAVARFHPEPLSHYPPTHSLGPLMRVIALVPIGAGGQAQPPLLFAYPCLE
jgi:4-amino-4-deoxy-L-arabinose transferase-like glycosyltransferase